MAGDGRWGNGRGHRAEEVDEEGGGMFNGGKVRWLERTVGGFGGDVEQIGDIGLLVCVGCGCCCAGGPSSKAGGFCRIACVG